MYKIELFQTDEDLKNFAHSKMVKLKADCLNCFGLCCVALYFSPMDGFPIEKEAGQPCINLQSDFSCSIHKSLSKRGLKGCIAYDCFGSGQKVSQVSFEGKSWMECQESKEQMFKVFQNMRYLHELLWYLTQAITLKPAQSIYDQIKSLIEETEKITNMSPDILMNLEVGNHREIVNEVLLKTSELVRNEINLSQKPYYKSYRTYKLRADLVGADLRKNYLIGANLRGACLIAADLREVDLRGVDFIGADFRDADIRGADLSGSIFLTQVQINVAKGDLNTKLPPLLSYPIHWKQINNKKD
ncbi:UNVERIFIED_CONTAM: uncharacterized protein YjbI with pentapeptide repeats [Acetivibrio alkalicellulosi]